MIAKKMQQNQSFSKSPANHCKDLLQYILTARKKDVETEEKLLFSGAIGMLSEDCQDTYAVIAEQIGLVTETKSPNPLLHYVISVHSEENEQLDGEAARKISESFMESLELKGFSAVYAVHGNTNNRHLHLVINRVNPVTCKVKDVKFDILQAHKAIAKIEVEQGFKPEENAKYLYKDGQIIDNPSYSKGVSDRGKREEYKRGSESDERVIRGMAPLLAQAKNWQEVHENLAAHGVKYVRLKKGGASLKRGASWVKASDVSRYASLRYMEERLGAFEPAAKKTMKKQELKEMKPRSFIQRPRTNNDLICIAIMVILRVMKEAIFGKTVIYKEKKAQVEARGWKGRGAELNKLRSEMSTAHKQDVKEIKALYLSLCKKTKAADEQILINTIKDKGNLDEAAWADLYEREKIGKITLNTQQIDKDFSNIISALGADSYEVLLKSTENEGKSSLKSGLHEVQGEKGMKTYMTPDELDIEAYEIINKNLQGYGVMLHPHSTKYFYILLDDIKSDMLQQLKKDGYAPALVYQTSPKNFQAVLRVEKTGDQEKTAAIKVSKFLAEKYGCDMGAIGAEKNFRLPGSFNNKNIHLTNGLPPRCEIIEASNISCTQARAMLDQLQKAQPEQVTRPGQITMAQHVESYEKGLQLYKLHEEGVKRSMKSGLSGHDIDFYVAKRLVATGHSEAEISKIIENSVRKFRPESSHLPDIEKYAQETTRNAKALETAKPAPENLYRLWKDKEKKILREEEEKFEEKKAQNREIER